MIEGNILRLKSHMLVKNLRRPSDFILANNGYFGGI